MATARPFAAVRCSPVVSVMLLVALTPLGAVWAINYRSSIARLNADIEQRLFEQTRRKLVLDVLSLLEHQLEKNRIRVVRELADDLPHPQQPHVAVVAEEAGEGDDHVAGDVVEHRVSQRPVVLGDHAGEDDAEGVARDGDAPVADGDIGATRRRARAVDNHGAFDEDGLQAQVVIQHHDVGHAPWLRKVGILVSAPFDGSPPA